MRIVAGEFKGQRLQAPRGPRTRPTADRVREAIFSMLGSVEGIRVLDLFAGTGALGIEALSRGAAMAVFVEHDARALGILARNLATVGAEGIVRPRDAVGYLRSATAREDGPFDLVFIDPPYDSALRLTAALGEWLPAILTEEARIVTESDKRRPLELSVPLLKERMYGDTRIAIHRA